MSVHEAYSAASAKLIGEKQTARWLNFKEDKHRLVLRVQLGTEDVVNFLYLLYQWARGAIQFILENTIAKANPALAAKFAITVLTTVTAIWLIFEFVTAAKSVVRVIVVLGWALLIASMVIAFHIA